MTRIEFELIYRCVFKPQFQVANFVEKRGIFVSYLGGTASANGPGYEQFWTAHRHDRWTGPDPII